MLIPGVGSGTLNPTEPVTLVCPGNVDTPEVTSALRAAPSCRSTDTGIRLPPMRRKAAVPPYEVTRPFKAAGFHEATPAVSVIVPSPREARPPNASPPPELSLGEP